MVTGDERMLVILAPAKDSFGDCPTLFHALLTVRGSRSMERNHPLSSKRLT